MIFFESIWQFPILVANKIVLVLCFHCFNVSVSDCFISIWLACPIRGEITALHQSYQMDFTCPDSSSSLLVFPFPVLSQMPSLHQYSALVMGSRVTTCLSLRKITDWHSELILGLLRQLIPLRLLSLNKVKSHPGQKNVMPPTKKEPWHDKSRPPLSYEYKTKRKDRMSWMDFFLFFS